VLKAISLVKRFPIAYCRFHALIAPLSLCSEFGLYLSHLECLLVDSLGFCNPPFLFEPSEDLTSPAPILTYSAQSRFGSASLSFRPGKSCSSAIEWSLLVRLFSGSTPWFQIEWPVPCCSNSWGQTWDCCSPF